MPLIAFTAYVVQGLCYSASIWLNLVWRQLTLDRGWDWQSSVLISNPNAIAKLLELPKQ